MKLKNVLFIIFSFLFLIPTDTFALSSDYQDKVYNVVGETVVEDKVNIYLFYGNGCPHCAKEEAFLDRLEEKYQGKINVYRYETWYNSANKNLMLSIKTLFGVNATTGVPFTVMGEEYYPGYNDYVGKKIEDKLREYLEIDTITEDVVDENKENIPFLGEVDVKEVSIGLIAVILGLVDGFNPCAMWILLFLINMLFEMKNKKRMLLFGLTFLTVSGIVYFLSMLGITEIFSLISVPLVRSFIGIVAFIAGLLNIRKYITTRNEENCCHLVDNKKRKKIFNRIQKFTAEKNLLLALIGVIVLAVSVNIVELACSTVFPATFAEILAVNEVTGFLKIIYLLIYTLFYMLDDMVVFVIAVATLNIAASSTKYGKYSSLIGGIIMLLMGLLLVFKPEWVMFNF